VRRRPYSVILLDEVEKAHPDVFNILLQVLDDGRLTDGHGRTVDFRNTVIVMTSNLGSQRIQDQEQIKLIAGIQLGSLRKRLTTNGYLFEFSEAAMDLLGEAGFDPVYGARPLKRAIQNEIENPLAQKILSGEYATGDTISVDVKDGRFTFA